MDESQSIMLNEGSQKQKVPISNIVSVLGHITNLNKLERIKIIHGMFSNHNEIKSEINSRKNSKYVEIKQNTHK